MERTPPPTPWQGLKRKIRNVLQIICPDRGPSLGPQMFFGGWLDVSTKEVS
jgi:hypothetical protein